MDNKSRMVAFTYACTTPGREGRYLTLCTSGSSIQTSICGKTPLFCDFSCLFVHLQSVIELFETVKPRGKPHKLSYTVSSLTNVAKQLIFLDLNFGAFLSF